MPTLPKHTRTLSPSVGPSIPAVAGEEGKCCLAAASFPTERQPGSLQACCFTSGAHNHQGRLHPLPSAVTAARWVVGGTGIPACLPPGVSLQLAENCPRAGTAPVKSEEDVSLLTIFAVCVSRQMKLINKGRNVTLSKVLTSKSKYLHRCAGSCQLLGIAMFLDQFMPLTAPALFSHCSAPAAPWEAARPGGGQGLQHRGKKGSSARMHRREDVGHLGYLHRRGVYFSPVVSEPHFFFSQE